MEGWMGARKRLARPVRRPTLAFASGSKMIPPHEYVVQNAENAAMVLALAHHIFEHGIEGRFYSQTRKYHHEGGKVYWSMAATPEAATLINRCDEGQTYEARLSAGTLPKR